MDETHNTAQPLTDEQMVQQAFNHLLDTYLHSSHRKKVDIITKAFNFANQAHKGVRRLSGEPYIMHPIAVAQIACEEMGLGSTSICCALLHDVVEDTDYTVDDISNIFNPKVAQIVDGLTKISGGIFGEKASAQAESFKKLLLTMSEDIRVILIKICDRLHNMRTLGSQLPGKQYKIAGETLYIYAPLANRLGLNKIKEELEDLSFRHEHPEEYRIICQKRQDIQGELDTVFSDFTEPIRKELDAQNIKYTIRARIKTPYSIWTKMQNRHIPFEEVYDILAVRIIFEPESPEKEITECFQIYAVCSGIYKPHPERLRDWLSHPKANGYQALHTTLMSHGGRWIEVQIRSKRMDEIAEQGFAAHWKYKDTPTDADGHHQDLPHDDGETELENWLHTIKEILGNPQPNAMDFLDTIKLNLYANEIFVVTPKGDFKTLPAGSTALDFAFSIHTFLGTHCMGAKVNHQLVPLNFRLHSGDQVEVLTSRQMTVEEDWLKFITTAKARSKVIAILRRKDREKQKEGERMLMEFFKEQEMDPNSLNIDRLCALHGMRSREALYSAIGAQKVILGRDDKEVMTGKRHSKGWRRYLPSFRRQKTAQPGPEANAGEDERLVHRNVDRKKTIMLSEENINRYIICPTCNPIPGDPILGYLDPMHHITIHKRQCPQTIRLKSSDGNHILAAKWDMHRKQFFPGVIRIEGIDHVGVLHQITEVLSRQLNMNILHLNVDVHDGIFEADIKLEVHDAEDLEAICHDIRLIKEIDTVTRVD